MTQWLNRTAVPILNNLRFGMAYPRASDADISGFLWYAERNLWRSFGEVAHCCAF